MKTTPNEQQLRDELRALDAYIAEHVMGWKLGWQDNERVWVGSVKPNLVFYYNPTTNPEDAMQVLEKIVSHIGGVEIWQGANGWTLKTEQRSYAHISALSYSLPIAICRFARTLFESEGKK